MNPETYIFGQRHWKFEVETHDFLDKYILIGEMNNDNYIGCKRPDKNHLKVCPNRVCHYGSSLLHTVVNKNSEGMRDLKKGLKFDIFTLLKPL